MRPVHNLPLRRLSISALLFAAALAGAPALPEKPSPPSVVEVVGTALRNNRELEAFRLRADAADHRARRARLLPSLRLQADATFNIEGSPRQSAGLSQEIPWFGTLREEGAAADAEVEALLAALEAAELDLIEETGVTWYELAHTATAIELTRQTVQLLEDLLPVVETRVAGGADLSELLRLQVEVTRLEDRLASLEVDREAFIDHIEALMNTSLPGLREARLTEAPAPVETSLEEWNGLLERWNPRLAILRSQARSAAARRTLARLESFPTFNVGLSYTRSDDSSDMMTREEPWALMLGINMPIRGERKRSAVREETALREAILAEIDNRSERLRAQLSTAAARLQDTHRRIVLFEDNLLGLAEQARDLSRSSYEGGRATLLEVIDSERTLIDLRLEYWRAAADAWQQRLAIQSLINQPVFISSDFSAQ